MKSHRPLRLLVFSVLLMLCTAASAAGFPLNATPALPVSSANNIKQVSYQWLKEYAGPKYWDAEPHNALLITSPDGNELIPGPDDMVRVIITLDEASIAEYALNLDASLPDREHHSLVEAHAQALNHQQDAFLAALQMQDITVIEIARNQFLINSMTVFTEAANLLKLSQMRSVSQVTPDFQMKSELVDSVPLIGAPEVWAFSTPSGVNITGVDKIVAVIDTGIDYTHPDLGGCLGTGCKVMGGYDFINLDNDPMDDYGHGTHVSGIIAANGTLTGVAPDAFLLAYKVLDENGVGYASDVISAIESAVLANADVINISLGGPGNPDDPLSTTVDFATQMGVVVVASAGNRGPNYATIDSPGLARSAITVGSTTKSDTLSSFSSRGPVASSELTIKPDLLAPGQSINSTVPISGILGSATRYRSLSGTSMSAPHVAGAAALLRQYKPAWSPLMVKTALMNLAVDKGLNHLVQGVGRLDLTHLDTLNTLMSPGMIDFGIDDLSQAEWSAERMLTITNWQTTPRFFELALVNTLPPGIDLSITPSQFTLAAGQSIMVSLAIEVENALVANISAPPYSYINTIGVDDGTTTRRIPLSFVKMPMLDVEINSDPWVVIVHNRTDLIRSSSFDYHPIYFLPEGNYDVMIQFLDGKSRLVKENVPVETITHLDFDLTDAVHQVDMVMRDIENEIILFDDLYMQQRMPTALVLKGSAYGLYSLGRSCIGEEICDHLRFSDISEDYTFEIVIPAQSVATENIYYRFHHQLSDGINSDLSLENDPTQLKPMLFQIPAPKSGDSMTLVRWIGSKDILTTDQTAYRTITYPYQEMTYYQPLAEDAVMKFEMLGYFEGVSIPSAPFPGLYQTPLFYATYGSTLKLFPTNQPTQLLSSLQNDTWVIDQAPPHWMGELVRDEDYIWVKSLVGANALFTSQSQDFKPQGALSYELAKDGITYLFGLVSANQKLPLAGDGNYQLSLSTSTYTVGVLTGTAQVELVFDPSLEDSVPPQLQSLVIKDEQGYYDILPAGKLLTLALQVFDESGIGSIEMLYDSGDGWQALTPVVIGNTAEAMLPEFAEHTYVNLKFVITDVVGNQLTYLLEPGLLMTGNYELIFPLAFNH